MIDKGLKSNTRSSVLSSRISFSVGIRKYSLFKRSQQRGSKWPTVIVPVSRVSLGSLAIHQPMPSVLRSLRTPQSSFKLIMMPSPTASISVFKCNLLSAARIAGGGSWADGTSYDNSVRTPILENNLRWRRCVPILSLDNFAFRISAESFISRSIRSTPPSQARDSSKPFAHRMSRSNPGRRLRSSREGRSGYQSGPSSSSFPLQPGHT